MNINNLGVIGVTVIIIISMLVVGSSIDKSEDLYIRNSKGNYWTADGNNIQLAIWDLNDTNGGTVWLPSGRLYISKTIEINKCVNLIGTGTGESGTGQWKTTIYLNSNSNCNGINISSPSQNLYFPRLSGFLLHGNKNNNGIGESCGIVVGNHVSDALFDSIL